MPIANLHVLYAWGERDNPPYRLWRMVEMRVLKLDETPWQSPSVPLTDNAGEPGEIRCAELSEAAGIVIFYEHEHETGLVTILYVGRQDR